MLDDLQNGTNLILDRYAFSGVAFSSAKVLFIFFFLTKKYFYPLNTMFITFLN